MAIHVDGTPEFSKLYFSLDKKSQLYKELDGILERLKENPILGDLIEFKRIPKPLQKKHDLNNLFRIEVNRDWRLFYTLVGWPKQKKVYVLSAMPHKEYDKLFKLGLF